MVEKAGRTKAKGAVLPCCPCPTRTRGRRPRCGRGCDCDSVYQCFKLKKSQYMLLDLSFRVHLGVDLNN